MLLISIIITTASKTIRTINFIMIVMGAVKHSLEHSSSSTDKLIYVTITTKT